MITTLAVGCGARALAPIASTRSARAPADIVTFRVPSDSMLPTLKAGSMITVDLHAYRRRKPTVGDIALFHPPRGADPITPVCRVAREGGGYPRACGMPTPRESKRFVERIVGLPGDRISIRNGHVVRNGRREHDPYIIACGGDSSCNFHTPVVIPQGDYFMMGDNRGFSDDSRFWGPVRKSWLLGKVIRHTS